MDVFIEGQRTATAPRCLLCEEGSASMLVVWILRLVLLVLFLPLLIPFGILVSSFVVAPISIALLLLALALLALAAVLGLILGVLGTLADVLIVLMLLGIAWKWPRGIRAQLPVKLRLAYRGLGNAIRQQFRHCSATDFALCLSVAMIAIILSLSSGLLHFALTILVVLVIVGLVWKWPRGKHIPLLRKLKIALRTLWDDLRARFR